MSLSFVWKDKFDEKLTDIGASSSRKKNPHQGELEKTDYVAIAAYIVHMTVTQTPEKRLGSHHIFVLVMSFKMGKQ